MYAQRDETPMNKHQKKPKIESITIKQHTDEMQDVSYLETKYDDDAHKILSSCRYGPKEIKRYGWAKVKRWIQEDMKRLEQFNRGELWQIGIVATCTVSYPINKTDRRLETFTSGGLWGIDSDSGPEYFKQVEQEQLADLKEHLEHFNVDTSNFDQIPIQHNE